MLMSAKPKNTASGKPKAKYEGNLRRYAGLVIVLAIVAGVACLSIFAAHNPRQTEQTTPETTRSIDKVPDKGPAFFVLDLGGLKLRGLEGSREMNIKWPDDVSRLGSPLSQVRGVDLDTGQPTWLDSGFVRASSTIWRSPDGRRSARLAPDKADGTSAVEIRQGNESTVLVLRLKNGRKVNQAQLLGWLDKDSLALFGAATSSFYIYALDLNGSVTPLVQLQDDAWLSKAVAGSVYYLRATQGEGIETPQLPPSSLWRVSPTGQKNQLLEEPVHVIQDFVADDQAVVYSLENGQMKKFADNKIVDLGTGRPFMRLPGLGTLCLQNGKWVVLKDSGEAIDLKGVATPGALFYLPQARLD